MIGTREEILDRIAVLLGSVSGALAYRNRADFTDDQLPVIVMLDGVEEIVSQMPAARTKMSPAVMVLRPEIVVIAHPRDTPSNLELDGVSAPIGPELSDWRDKVLTAVINDLELLSLLSSNGTIVYRGCDTDMRWGSSMSGALQIHIDFTYVWVPPA